jgi:hypothetical protein
MLVPCNLKASTYRIFRLWLECYSLVVRNFIINRIVIAPWYVRNSDLHRDLGIETVTDIIAKFANSHEKRIQDHINIEASCQNTL